MMSSSLIARIHRRLPAPAQALPFVMALESARRAGWLQPPAALDGHAFRLGVEDLGLDLRFRCVGGVFRMGPFDPGSAPALTLRARAADYLQLLAGHADTDTLFFQRRLSIHGDTALGLEVKYWLDATPRPAWVEPFVTRLAVLFPEVRAV
ncbi:MULTISPECIES: ubiquinone anaerobic biosynthesis accessory factor UbiT [Cupriavidus]|uniref:ubiquinone anaerobic biosynthesis accessory factor UbiT n=1 Tax=Cupriavidus TaxID=106589 RepID=UPI003709BE9D